MQTKLTLRMDSELIEEAKKIAEHRNVSLSRLVADFFNALSKREFSVEIGDLPPRTRSLYGALEGRALAGEKDDYLEFLEEKYS